MMTDRISAEKRSWNMSQVRSKDTAPELLVRSLMHRMGLRFRVHSKNLPGTPDLVLPKYRTAVFVHGCYWHRHNGCKYTTTPKTNTAFWEKKFMRNVNRDRGNQQMLEEAGWNVLVIWQCQTKDIVRLEKIISAAFRIEG
jgi:DNA mismatch endonuclease (patch repair protein)